MSFPDGHAAHWLGPYTHAVAVTPSDSADLAQVARALICSDDGASAAGNVKVTTAEGDTVVLPQVAPGVVIPVAVKRVWSTSTTVSTVVALW